MVDLRANPFYLNDAQCEWVEKTLASMTLREKAGQIFCPLGFSDEDGLLHHMVQELGVGGMMYRPNTLENVVKTHSKIQNMAKIPLLLAANTESGGNGITMQGTSFGRPMAVAATGNPENAYKMGYVACAEGAALGMNWSFAPIVDIDLNFHNPITNVRTFGSNPETVRSCGEQYLKAADDCGVAVSIKHFPGDGADERDQHLLTSINSLSCEDWDKSYGYVYSSLIEQGAKTVMVGHIAQPAYVERLNPQASVEEKLRPATLSKELLTGLLRGKLGFNGLICTDATPMLGFSVAMPREQAIPTVIASGADMILFNKSLDEDYGYLMKGLEKGLLTEERLDEAVTRILATKASLGLHEKTEFIGDTSIVGCEKHKQWAREVADDSVTLVKDTQHLLPLSPEKTKRVYLNVIQKDMDPNHPYVKMWKSLFEKEGFDVTVRDRTVSISVAEWWAQDQVTDEDKKALIREVLRSVEDTKKTYDLYVYIANVENGSNNTTMRLDWNVIFGNGDDAPWLTAEVPVMMISTCCPYHLFDAPMIKTYINAYDGNPEFCKAIMEKIMGRSEFKGVSPVDPFCGNPYLKMDSGV